MKPKQPEDNIDVRCSICCNIFKILDLDPDSDKCPFCSTSVKPQLPSEDITLTINWQDLRILSNWALLWANEHLSDDKEATSRIQSILDILRQVRPFNSAYLTVDEEIEELRRMGIDFGPDDIDDPTRC